MLLSVLSRPEIRGRLVALLGVLVANAFIWIDWLAETGYLLPGFMLGMLIFLIGARDTRDRKEH